MRNFFTSFHCTSQAHCGTCRWQSEEGRKWRDSIARHYDVPEIDFECPHGKPWTKELKQAKIKGAKAQRHKEAQQREDIPADAISICQNCHEARSCPNTTVCCGGKLLVHIIVPCPHGYWTIQPVAESGSVSPG